MAYFLFTACAAVLEADPQHILHASFPDGTGLEIFTETTGASPIDSVGFALAINNRNSLIP